MISRWCMIVWFRYITLLTALLISTINSWLMDIAISPRRHTAWEFRVLWEATLVFEFFIVRMHAFTQYPWGPDSNGYKRRTSLFIIESRWGFASAR